MASRAGPAGAGKGKAEPLPASSAHHLPAAPGFLQGDELPHREHSRGQLCPVRGLQQHPAGTHSHLLPGAAGPAARLHASLHSRLHRGVPAGQDGAGVHTRTCTYTSMHTDAARANSFLPLPGPSSGSQVQTRPYPAGMWGAVGKRAAPAAPAGLAGLSCGLLGCRPAGQSQGEQRGPKAERAQVGGGEDTTEKQPGPLRLTGLAPLQRGLLAQGSLQGDLSPRELTAPTEL